ncbi:MAG TPA: hypothetical protein VK842_08685 [bacterium]|nr:hypothetical protein [bacterium]
MRPAWAILAAALALAAARPLRAGASVSAAYLLRGVSPQEDALGQCALAADQSPAELWRNPAAQGGTGLALTHGLGPLGGDVEYAAAELSWGRQSLGFQGFYQGDSDTFRDDLGQIGASFTDQESLLGLAYALGLGNASVGAGVKVLGESLAGQQADPGVLADLGCLWRFWGRRVQLSLAAQNLGIAPHWAGSPQYSPATLGLSAREALGAAGRLRMYQDARLVLPMAPSGVATQGAPVLGGLGLEWALPTPSLPVFLRVGYAQGDNQPSGAYGVSAGFGLAWQKLGFDYAFTSLGDLGASNRLGLSWDFGPGPAAGAL